MSADIVSFTILHMRSTGMEKRVGIAIHFLVLKFSHVCARKINGGFLISRSRFHKHLDVFLLIMVNVNDCIVDFHAFPNAYVIKIFI
mmetsp:Transcript_13129/g.51385  ORF Transcript_13129/g.51385 Transcript_13129/m.51385 type:complete len:87 (+) Transcript_13129:1870-2130(+)